MLLNKKQLAEYLDIERKTLDAWIKKGLPCYKHGRTYRFDLDEVKAWLKEG